MPPSRRPSRSQKVSTESAVSERPVSPTDAPPTIRILHLEDSPADALLIKTIIESDDDPLDVSISVVSNEKGFLEALRAGCLDLILCDYRLPGYDGELALKAAKELCPDVPVIMVTGEMGEERAIETLKAGAVDYILKDGLRRLVPSIRRALKEATLKRERLESGEKYRILVENSLDGIFINQGDSIRYVNPKAVKLLGAQHPEELLGKSIFEIFHPDYHPVIRARLQDMKESGAPAPPLEEKIVRLDGTILDVETTAAPIIFKNESAVQVVLRDITERKRVEEALRRTESIYRAIGETINYGIWICDPNGRNTYASPSLLTLVGITQEECSEFGWGDYLHPDDTADTLAAWQTCVREGSFWEREHRYRGVDGKYHHILARGVPVRDARGEIICWAGINLDIDEMKRKEEALRKSEERFSAAFDGSPFPQSLSRVSDGMFLEMNSSFLAFYGMKREELLGRTSIGVGIVADPQERKELIERLHRDGAVHGFEMHVKSRVSGERLVLLSVSLLKTAPDPTMLTVFSDITDSKKAEQERMEAVRRLQEVIDGASSAIYAKDREGRFLFVNRRLEEMLGIARSALSGKSDYELFSKESAESYRVHDVRVLEKGESIQVEEAADLADGKHHVFLADKFPLRDKQGNIVAVCGISHDITYRKEIEQKLQESEARFRLMADSTPVLIWVYDAHGGLEYVNKSYEEFFGVREAELRVHDKWQPPLHPDDADEYLKHFREAITNHSFFLAEARVRHQSGEWRWIQSYGAPRFSATGEYLGIVGSSPDITHRKHIEETLKRTADNLRLMVEAASSPMMIVSGEGIVDSVNRAAAFLLGYGEGELDGKSVQTLIVPMSRMEVVMRLDDLRKHAPLPITATLRVQLKNGKTEWMTVEASLVALGIEQEKYLIRLQRLNLEPSANAEKEHLRP